MTFCNRIIDSNGEVNVETVGGDFMMVTVKFTVFVKGTEPLNRDNFVSVWESAKRKIVESYHRNWKKLRPKSEPKEQIADEVRRKLKL